MTKKTFNIKLASKEVLSGGWGVFPKMKFVLFGFWADFLNFREKIQNGGVQKWTDDEILFRVLEKRIGHYLIVTMVYRRCVAILNVSSGW